MINGKPYSVRWWLDIHNIYNRKAIALMIRYLNNDNDVEILKEYEHCYNTILWIQKRLILKYDKSLVCC